MKEQLKKVRHNYIRYANCWEDADILLEGLEISAKDRVLSIGSAGDNSFSILSKDPELVVAVDINEVQLNLIELKKAAIKALDYPSFLMFLGFRDCSDRIVIFELVKEYLTDDLIIFWESRMEEIAAGIIYQGKFEKYFGLFKHKVLPLIHTKKRINQLFVEKTKEEQDIFYAKKWNNWRWKLLFKIFFSKFIMGRFGRDPQFMAEVKVKVSDFIYQKANTHLRSKESQSNYFLHFIMKGYFGEALPHYAREENYEKIKSNIDRIVVFKGFAEDVFNKYSGFNKFNLSNIFEYMPMDTFQHIVHNFESNSEPNSKFCYWNLMVPRNMSEVNNLISNDKSRTKKLSDKDKGFFYARFVVDHRR